LMFTVSIPIVDGWNATQVFFQRFFFFLRFFSLV